MPPDEAMTGSRAFRGEHQAKPLKFDPAKLKGLSEQLIRSHWERADTKRGTRSSRRWPMAWPADPAG